jgi:hypothetical protein
MKNVYVYCEGQTEESFVNEILTPYFINHGILLCPIICQTSRKGGVKHKGGVMNYNKIRAELKRLCQEHHYEHVTTMFDYYGMPKDTPGIACNLRDPMDRMLYIERQVNQDIGAENCHFHFMLHEFEAVLFSNPAAFGGIATKEQVEKIAAIREAFDTPEHINNSPATAPSKRLQKIIPGYGKVRTGVIVAKTIGIDAMMEECPHFKRWIEEILSW